MLHSLLRRQRGYSYIEALIMLAVFAILLVAAVPSAKYRLTKEKEQELRVSLSQLRGAIDAYKTAAGSGHIAMLPGDSGYPKTLDDLVNGVPDALNAGHTLYFLRSMPRDPFFKDKGAPAASTWAPRSSESPPDNPQPGPDVYDVHSTIADKGLNGVPYNQW